MPSRFRSHLALPPAWIARCLPLLLLLPPSANPAIQSHIEVETLIEEAKSLQAQGETSRAWDAWTRIIEQLRREKQPELLSGALNDASLLACILGEYSTAVSMASEAAEIRSVLGDRQAWARSINNTGLAYLYLGNYEAALERYGAALSLDRESNDREGQVVRLNNIGNVLYFQGAYTEALSRYQEALVVLETAPSGEGWHQRRRFITLVNIAVLYQKLGLYQRALDIYLALRSEDHPVSQAEQAQQLSNLGVLYRHLGDPFKAMEEYGRALELFRDEGNLDGELGVLKNMAIAQATDLGDPSRALSLFSEILTIARTTSNRREEMQASLYMAEALRREGRLEAAGEHFQRTLEIAEGLQTSEEAWRALFGLGLLANARGRAEAALAYLDRSLVLIESLSSRLQVTSLKPGFLSEKRDVYDALIENLIRREVRESCGPSKSGQCLMTLEEQPAQRLFGLFERARFQNFQEQMSGLPDRRAGAGDGPALDRLEELRVQLSRLWSLQLRTEHSDERSQLQNQINTLETEYTGLEATIAGGDGHMAATEQSLRLIQDRLPHDSLLLSYWLGTGGSAVIAVSHGEVQLMWQEGNPQELINDCVVLLSNPGRKDWTDGCAELRQMLVGSLLDSREAGQLLIVPDKDLVFLPFETLPGGPDRQPLINEYTVSYLPSADLGLLENRRGWAHRLPWQESLRAIGAPEIAGGDTGLEFDDGSMRLPFAEEELAFVSRQLPGRAEVWVGRAARKKAFLEAFRSSAPILHVATHASVDSERPERSRILFSPTTEDEGADYLFLGEILSLGMQDKDMIVLSACETARGPAARRGGVQDFSRAFLLGGARSTVASLWRVNDQASAEFMKGFYASLARGLSKAAALREAKLRFLQSGSNVSHPYYWAAFVLSGDGSSPVPLSISWGALLSPLLLLGLLSWLIFGILLKKNRSRGT